MKFQIRYAVLTFMLFWISCNSDTTPGIGDMNPTGTIWSGSTVNFIKENGPDPQDPSNQDRLTDKVWITRGNNGGQIYNILSESSADKDDSPTGTEWAIGTTDNVSSLNFKPFRSAVGEPKGVVGKNLVMHLIEDDIYLNVTFTSWSQNKQGGFSYNRATQ